MLAGLSLRRGVEEVNCENLQIVRCQHNVLHIKSFDSKFHFQARQKMIKLKVHYEGLSKLVLMGNAMSCAPMERIRLLSGYHVDRGRLTILRSEERRVGKECSS